MIWIAFFYKNDRFLKRKICRTIEEITMLFDIARKIGADRIDIANMITPYLDTWIKEKENWKLMK